GTSPAEHTVVAFASANYSVAPSAGSVALTITRAGSASAPVTVHYSTLDDTAVAGTQYQATQGTLEWAENDSTPKTITVPVIDAASAGEKSFHVVLVDPSTEVTVGNPGNATVTISDGAAASSVTAEM